MDWLARFDLNGFANRSHHFAVPQSLLGTSVTCMALEVFVIRLLASKIHNLHNLVLVDVHVRSNCVAFQINHFLKFCVSAILLVDPGTGVVITATMKHVFERCEEQSKVRTFSRPNDLVQKTLVSAYQSRHPQTILCVFVIQKVAQEVRGIRVMRVPTAEDLSEVSVRLCENLRCGQEHRCRLCVYHVVREHQAVTCRDWLDFMSHVSVPVQVSTRKGNNMYAQMFHSPSSH